MTAVAPGFDTALPRPHAARPVVTVAVGLGCAAALVVPSGPPGVGLVVLGLVAWLLVVRFGSDRVRGWRRVHGAAALLLLLASAAVRDAPWLIALDLLAAGATGSLALTRAGTWTGVLAATAAVLRRVPVAAPWLTRGARAAWPGSRVAGPTARGLALSALVLALFVPLLATADAAFSVLLHKLVPEPPDAERLPARVAFGLLAAVVVGAAAHLRLQPPPEPSLAPPSRLATRTEWLLPLLALDLLLGAFLLAHGSVLVGGSDHVLETAGTTYASYAREGFGQLVAVTALVLVVVAVAVRWAPRGARPLLGVLCGLALAVDVSALSRLNLYVDAYGLTRLRVSAAVLAAWLGVILLLVLVAGIRHGRWLPHAVVVSASLSLLVLTAGDPDARIAASALDRGDKADLTYLAGLSSDAVPVLDRLPEPQRSCVLGGDRTPQPWTSANLSRARAQQVLADRPTEPSLCRW